MTRRILIVDDNEDARRILGLRLQNAGFSVGSAVDGAEGLEQMRGSKWDLVLLDLVMPHTDGFAFLSEIARTAHPPVVVVTQYDDAESRERALALGAERCVSKVRAFERSFVGEVRTWISENRRKRPK